MSPCCDFTSVRIAGLKSYQKTDYAENGTILFSLSNETFIKTFTSIKATQMGRLLFSMKKTMRHLMSNTFITNGIIKKCRCRIKQ